MEPVENNNSIIQNKIYCPYCKITINKSHKSRHNKTEKHKINVINFENPQNERKEKLENIQLNEIKCDVCNENISERNYDRHIETQKHKRNINKSILGEDYIDDEKLIQKIKPKIEIKIEKPYMENVRNYINSLKTKDIIKIIETLHSKFGPSAIIFRFHKGVTMDDYRKYLEIMENIMNFITDVEYPKISISGKVRFMKSEDKPEYNVQTRSVEIIAKQQIKEQLNIVFTDFRKRVEERFYKDSGLQLDEIIYLDL